MEEVVGQPYAIDVTRYLLDKDGMHPFMSAAGYMAYAKAFNVLVPVPDIGVLLDTKHKFFKLGSDAFTSALCIDSSVQLLNEFHNSAILLNEFHNSAILVKPNCRYIMVIDIVDQGDAVVALRCRLYEIEISFCPKISEEWAAQLGFMAHEAIMHDKDKLEVRFVKPSSAHHYKSFVLDVTYPDWTYLPDVARRTEDIYTQLFYDAVSYEIHCIGYGPQSNTLIVEVM